MPEPISLLAGLLSWAGQTAAAGMAGGEAHRLFRRWWETVRDPQTGLPRGAGHPAPAPRCANWSGTVS